MITNVSQFDADVAAIESEAAVNGPLVFRYLGKEYVGQRTPIIDKMVMDDAGFLPGFDFEMDVRASQFVSPLTPPNNSDVIEIGDTKYRIASTTPDQYGIVIRYTVKEESNG